MTKPHAIIEQQEKIKKMFSYKAGMTITENEKLYYKDAKQINEIAPLAAVGWGLTAAWAGYEIWKWADNTWGSKSLSKRLRKALDRKTWAKLQSSVKKSSIKLGEDIGSKLKIISNSNAETYAENLYEAMDGAGTDERKIRRVMDNLGTFMDLSKVSAKFGQRASSWGGKRYSLWGWLDDELSQTYFKRYVTDPMKSKPLLVWDGRQYNDLEKWAVELTKLIQDKEAQPGQDADLKQQLIEKIVYKYGNCYKEYLKDTTLGWAGKGSEKQRRTKNIPYLKLVSGDMALGIFGNGRFYDIKQKKRGSIQKCSGAVTMTETVEDILKVDWVLGGLLSEQFNVIYDDDKDNVVTIIDDKKDETGGETDKPKSGDPVKKTSKWTIYPWKIVPTKGQEDTYMALYRYNTDKGHLIAQMQRLLCLKEDGYYGPDTVAKVKEFQKAHGLKVDGVIGPDTYVKLDEMGKDETMFSKETGNLNWCSGETAGETDEKVVDQVAEKEIETKVTEYINIPKENVPTERETLVKLVFDTENNEKMQKNNCQNLIAFERGMLRGNMARATDLKALGRCYDNHDFGWGGISKKVRKAYGLKTSKNNLG